MLFIYLLNVPFSVSLFPNRVGIRYSLVILFVLLLNGFLLTPSPKFSSHSLIQPPYLGLLEGTMKLTIGCISQWHHLKHQGCVLWLGYYPQSLFHQL